VIYSRDPDLLPKSIQRGWAQETLGHSKFESDPNFTQSDPAEGSISQKAAGWHVVE
jgi:hypothetical protein